MDKLVVKLAEATPVDTGHAAAGWHKEGTHIINDVPYVKELNEGSSQQAPANFIEQVISQPII